MRNPARTDGGETGGTGDAAATADEFSIVPRGRRAAAAYMRRRTKAFAVCHVAHTFGDAFATLDRMIAAKGMIGRDCASIASCWQFFYGAVGKGDPRCAAGSVLLMAETLRAGGCTDEETATVVQAMAAAAAACLLALDLRLVVPTKKSAAGM